MCREHDRLHQSHDIEFLNLRLTVTAAKLPSSDTTAPSKEDRDVNEQRSRTAAVSLCRVGFQSSVAGLVR